MLSSSQGARLLAGLLLALFAAAASAQSFRVQCPTHTKLHPFVDSSGNPNPAGDVPDPSGVYVNPNPHIKCQQISGGDGFATMGDGKQIYLFAFGPLSGLADMVQGRAGTETAAVYDQDNRQTTPEGYLPLDVEKIGAPQPSEPFNGAVGLVPDPEPFIDPISGQAVCPSGGRGTNGTCLDGYVDPRIIMDVGVMNGNMPAPLFVIDEGDEFFLTLTNVGMVMRPDLFEQHTVHYHGFPNASSFYDGVPDASVAINIGGSFTYYYNAPEAGTYEWHCHISPPEHLEMGMVGQVYVRPRQDHVTGDLGVALLNENKASWGGVECNDILCSQETTMPASSDVWSGGTDGATGVTRAEDASGNPVGEYAYNDGDGSTYFDVDYPINMHGFDPNFHFVGMTFNPESFTDTKDKYFMLNGRGYPDTVGGYVCGETGATTDPEPQCVGKADGTVVAGPEGTQSTDGTIHYSQPMNTLINIPLGGKALLRISDLNVTVYHTLASLGIPMEVVGYNARLLRDGDGNNMSYKTNSISLGGGESVDVILDACRVRASDGSCTTPYAAGSVFYLYTPQLDRLSNDNENFGGMMTEVHVLSCDPAHFNTTTKLCS